MFDVIPTPILIISIISGIASLAAGMVAVWHGIKYDQACRRDKHP